VLDDDREVHRRSHWLVIERGGAKAGLTNRSRDRSIEIMAGGFDHLDIFGLALLVDVEGEDNLRIIRQ
jgi:hypothetical protein